MLFEDINGEPRFVAGDDDSGEERNASITQKLFAGRSYIARLRLYYPGQSGKTTLMYSVQSQALAPDDAILSEGTPANRG